MSIKLLFFSVVLVALFCGLNCKESSKVLGKTKSDKSLERAFNEFRAASDGINKKLKDIKSEISNYHDQSGTTQFLRELDYLVKEILNLQRTILNNRKEDSLKKILEINNRFLKMSADWEIYKKERTTTTPAPFLDQKEDLLNLSDQIISIQFEVIRYYGDQKAKEALLTGLKELQALVNDILKNISSMNITKIKEKIRLVGETLAHLTADWNGLKNVSTKPTTVSPQLTTNSAIEDTRISMASTVRDLLIDLGDLKSQISISPMDADKAKPYLLAVKSAERLLLLIQSILPKIQVDSLFGRIFEVKDLIGDIIFDWNSNNLNPITTTSSPNDPFAEIKNSLNNLDSSLFSFKLDALSYPGDSTLVEAFLKRHAGIQSAADQLRSDLLYIDITKGISQFELLLASFRKLREDFNAFVEDEKASTLDIFDEVSSTAPTQP